MRHLLMAAYNFPPCEGVGGGLRSERMARHLPACGWMPTVLAHLEPGQKPDSTGQVHRVRSLTPWRRPYEVRPYGWAVSGALAARRLLREKPFDAIYVSCPPFPQAMTLARLARAVDKPVVVDFRDTWALDPYRSGSRLKKWAYGRVFPRWERGLMERIDALVLNTPSALRAYAERYPGLAPRMAYVPNGFDEADFADGLRDGHQESGRGRDWLEILHNGRFGIGARDPLPVFDALEAVRAKGFRMRLRIVGRQPPWLKDLVSRRGLGDAVSIEGEVPHAEAVRELRRCDVVLLLQGPGRSEVQAVAGKTYEYLRAGKPVLALVPPGDNHDLVSRYAACAERVEDFSRGAVESALIRLYTRWERGELQACADPDPEFLRLFEAKALAARLAQVLDAAVRGRTARPKP